ncbi:ATP-grasp fold amidoligase family protein [Exiguobacterium alkaliphilum]|uniref:ATP-grasp fold amidoligase family protein n=1 Tax=Exiguobacterium alkaliphilum TaxID=1428684 RepID=UPI00403ABF08
MLNSFKKKIKRINSIKYAYNLSVQLYYKYLISDERLIKSKFKKKLNREVNLSNPIYYNDKLQWLKLHWKDELAKQCADKYEVREYVKNKIGADYLNEVYGIYEDINEINFSELPESFVLKGTHGSGFNIICKNKNLLNWKSEKNKIQIWLKKNYYWQNREWVYKDLKPKIICEKFIEQESGEELRDYRFFCFNGEPKFISVDFSITQKQNTRRNLYDLNWNILDGEISYPKELDIKVEKPKKLDEMINLSRALSTGFPHARIDFYYIQNRIIFGEITFFHQSGMGEIRPVEFEKEMGSWLVIDQ